MSRKRYTPQDLLAMSVGKRDVDLDADQDGDGAITSADARLLQQQTDKDNAFAHMRDELLDELLEREAFSYDINADALYRQYRDAYTREGALAAEDAAGRAASLTGGYGNSYSATVASQAYNSYLQELGDRVPQLGADAYDRYRDRRDADWNRVRLLTELDKEKYRRVRDRYADEDAADAEAYAQRQDTVSFAFRAAEKGDYSFLETLGVDTSKLRSDDRAANAVLRAQYGDYSQLEKIGVDLAPLRAAQSAEENSPEAISVSIQRDAEETYYYSGYAALVRYLNRQIAYGQLTERGKQQVLWALVG